MYVNEESHDRESSMRAYRDFLADLPRFKAAMRRVLDEWPKSCEHFLTKTSTNRVAWLGQASMCIETGIPAKFKAGFSLLTEDEQRAANEAAEEVLTAWIVAHP